MSGRKLALISFGLMSLVGISLSWLSYHFWSENHRLKTEGVATTGTVVGHRRQEHDSNSRTRRRQDHTVAAVVEFVDSQGKIHTVASDIYSSPPRFQTGERVRLWYMPDSPEHILIAGAEEWLVRLVLGIVGGLLCLAGIPNFGKALFTS